MTRAIIVTIYTLGFVALLQAATVVSPVQRIERPDGVHLVVFVESEQQPRVTVEAGTIGGISMVVDRGQWRTTIAARLDVCDGVLLIDGAVVTRQRCVWLPQVGRE